MKLQVQKMCRSAMVNLQRIRAIRPYLTQECAQILVQGLVLSHLDYCNVTLIGLPDCDISKLQRLQNMAAKLVLRAGSRDSSTLCLFDLHWLPIKFRVQYKVLTLVFKAIHGLAPDYLRSMFTLRKLRGRAHDAQDTQLVVPFTARKTFADRSLRVHGAKLWNTGLNRELRTCTDYSKFAADLKTLLFSRAFLGLTNVIQ